MYTAIKKAGLLKCLLFVQELFSKIVSKTILLFHCAFTTLAPIYDLKGVHQYHRCGPFILFRLGLQVGLLLNSTQESHIHNTKLLYQVKTNHVESYKEYKGRRMENLFQVIDWYEQCYNTKMLLSKTYQPSSCQNWLQSPVLWTQLTYAIASKSILAFY